MFQVMKPATSADDNSDSDLDIDPLSPDLPSAVMDPTNLDIISLPNRAYDKAEEIARRVWEAGWTVVHHSHLPKWLRDNDFLIKGHRPPLNSFWACFKSIFRIHTETGNIWTHLLGTSYCFSVCVRMPVCMSTDACWIKVYESLSFDPLVQCPYHLNYQGS